MQKLQIKILGGPKCKATQTTYDRVVEVVQEMEIEAEITRITGAAEIAAYPIEYMPGIVVNEKLMYSTLGDITTRYSVKLIPPRHEDIRQILREFGDPSE